MGNAVVAAFWAAHSAHHLSPTMGLRFVGGLDEAQRGLSCALSTTASAHIQLTRLAERIGIDPTSFGEGTAEEDEEFRRHRGNLNQAAA